MKKLLITGLTALLLIPFSSFAYTPSDADTELMEKIEMRVQTLAEEKPQHLMKIAKRIEMIGDKLPEDSRAYYVISALYDMIMDALNETDSFEAYLDRLLGNSLNLDKKDKIKDKKKDKKDSDDDDSDDDDSDDDDSDDDDSDDDDSEDDDSEDDDSEDDDSEDDDSEDDDSEDDDSEDDDSEDDDSEDEDSEDDDSTTQV